MRQRSLHILQFKRLLLSILTPAGTGRLRLSSVDAGILVIRDKRRLSLGHITRVNNAEPSLSAEAHMIDVVRGSRKTLSSL
jgi:hypothetical protein